MNKKRVPKDEIFWMIMEIANKYLKKHLRKKKKEKNKEKVKEQ